MFPQTELNKLKLAEKRQVMDALLRSRFRAPRTFPLSHAQEQLWFMDKLQPGIPVYNIPLYVPFQGSFNLASLERALNALTRRHDMLRAHFDLVGGEPRQIIEPEVHVDLEVEDLSGLAGQEQSAALGRLLNAEAQQPFDLTADVCVRYKLFRLDAANHLLCATMHHIITDAWSLGIFVAELRKTYDAYRSGQQSAPLPPLQVEYSDYARWQRENLRSMRLKKLLRYWTEQLAGAPHILQLPTDHPRPKDKTFNGTVAGFVFDDELSEKLISFARARKVTTFTLLLVCYYALLYRYTGQEDILVGAPVAGRNHTELEPIIGIFVNTLILRVRLQDTQTFSDLLGDVQKTKLDAFEHQAMPFEKLVDELNVERVPGYSPLYQVVFNFQNASLIESANPRAEGEVMEEGDFPFVHSNTAKIDLNLTITQNDLRLSGGIEYNTDLFDAGTIEEMISHFQTIAEAVVTDPSISLLDIPLVADGSDSAGTDRGLEDEDWGDTMEFMDDDEFNFELND